MRIITILTSGILFFQNAAGQGKVVAVDSSGVERIFEKVDIEAKFPGGEREWRKYLEKNLNANVPVDHGAPAGSYTVFIQFIVDKEGNISNVKALTNHGYGMEEEVVKIINKGPQWVPASQNGRAVKAYRKQPVTFVVAADGFEISLKNDNVFYTGRETYVVIKVDKIKNENLDVSISQGTITYIGGNEYAVKVNKPGRVIITIFRKRDAKEIGAAIFDVKDAAKPTENTKPKTQDN
jgi:hypothetical protein